MARQPKELQGAGRCDRLWTPTGPDLGNSLEFTSKFCWKRVKAIHHTGFMQWPEDGSDVFGDGREVESPLELWRKIIIMKTATGAVSTQPALCQL